MHLEHIHSIKILPMIILAVCAISIIAYAIVAGREAAESAR